MADFERTTTLGVGADTAFAFFADPERIPEYVPTMAHVETIAVDGDESAEMDPRERQEADEALIEFTARVLALRMRWI